MFWEWLAWQIWADPQRVVTKENQTTSFHIWRHLELIGYHYA